MFDFIKNFFSGIATFFGGLLGGKKSKDAISGDKKSKDGTSTAAKVKKAKGYYMELDETGNVKAADSQKKPEPVKAAVATVEPPKAKSAEAKKPEPAKAEAVPSNGKVKIEAQPNPPASAPEASNGKVDPQRETTFAPNYLLSTASKGRRRPGPSMDLFRDMARQVKTPS